MIRTEIELHSGEDIKDLDALIEILSSLKVAHKNKPTVHIEETSDVDTHHLVITSGEE